MKFLTCIPSDFLDCGESDKKVFGLRCANHEFIKALLRYGAFTEYHFWINNEQGADAVDDCQAMYEKLTAICNRQRTIKVIPPDDIFEALKNNHYWVFHNLDPGLARPISLRRNFAIKRFPVTGVTHTLSGIAAKRVLTDVLLSPYRTFDALICTTESAKAAVRNLLKVIAEDLSDNWSFIGEDLRLEIIPFGVDVELYRPREKDKLRRRFGMPKDKVIFTCLSRLTPYDKMELVPLLKAFKDMILGSKMGRKAFLLIIGREQARDYAFLLRMMSQRLEIEDSVRIIADYNEEDVPLFYGLSDVFISPSDHIQETFGLTPVEAMSCGIPVVVSDWNGYKDTVLHGKTGFRVPTYWMDCNRESAMENRPDRQKETCFKLVQSVAVDVPAMTHYMKELLENEELRDNLGKQARRHIVNNYSWLKIIKRYEELWGNLNRTSALDNEGIRKKSHLYTVPFFEVFGHYSSRILKEDDEIRAISNDFMLYDNVTKLIRRDLCQKIFLMANTWRKIGDIYADIQAEEQLEREIINYHVMVLLKYGVLTVKIRDTKF